VEWVAVEGVPISDLDHPAQVHDGHPVGDVLHDGEVVSHEEQGQVQLLLELGEEIQDLGLDGHI
jgi:hypothetical protein